MFSLLYVLTCLDMVSSYTFFSSNSKEREENYGECAPDGDCSVQSFALSTYRLRLRF